MAVHQHLGKGLQLPNDTLFSVLGNGRKWQSAIASRSTGSPARLVVFGDSITEGLDASAGAYIGRIKKRLAPYNNFRLSPGWVHGSPNVAPLYSPYRFGLTTGTANTPTGQNVDDAHSLSRNGYSLASGSALTLQDYAGTNITTTTGPYWDTVEVHYCVFGTAASAGSLTVAIDGVNQTAINTLDVSVGTGNYEIRTVTYTVTRGQHTLTVTGSGGQPSLFGGVYLSDGDTVWVYQAGDSGTKVSSFNTAPTTGGSPLQGAKAIDADCILDNHGVNDFADGVATSTTNFSTFFTNAKLAYATGSDVPSLGYLLPYPAQGRSTTSPPWAHFVGSWKATMAALDVPVCDFSTMLSADAATTDPFQLIDDGGTANTHPLDAGAEYMADQLARFLGLTGIDWVAAASTLWSNIDLAETPFPQAIADTVRLRALDDSGNTKLVAMLPDGQLRYVSSTIKTDITPYAAIAGGGTTTIRETVPRNTGVISDINPLVSGTVYMVAIPLVAYETVTNITFMSGGTAAGTPTHWWFFIATNGRVVQRFTADQTTTAWGTNTTKTLALSTPYQAQISGNYYLGIMVTATTPPSLKGVAGDINVAGLTPILQGASSTTGQTTVPGSLTAGAITASGNRPYAYVS